MVYVYVSALSHSVSCGQLLAASGLRTQLQGCSQPLSVVASYLAHVSVTNQCMGREKDNQLASYPLAGLRQLAHWLANGQQTVIKMLSYLFLKRRSDTAGRILVVFQFSSLETENNNPQKNKDDVFALICSAQILLGTSECRSSSE